MLFFIESALEKRKNPIIPPLSHKNKSETNFKMKVKLLQSIFFAKQYSLIDNHSNVPRQLINLTEKQLNTMRFLKVDIIKIMQNINPNKATVLITSVFFILKICDILI